MHRHVWGTLRREWIIRWLLSWTFCDWSDLLFKVHWTFMGFHWGPFWPIGFPLDPSLLGLHGARKDVLGALWPLLESFLVSSSQIGVFGLPWCHLGHLYNLLLIYDSVTHYASSNRMICCTYPCICSTYPYVHDSLKLGPLHRTAGRFAPLASLPARLLI